MSVRWLRADDRVEGVSQMLAVGLGLEQDYFVDAGKYGSHLLAPTATDLDRFGKADTYVTSDQTGVS